MWGGGAEGIKRLGVRTGGKAAPPGRKRGVCGVGRVGGGAEREGEGGPEGGGGGKKGPRVLWGWRLEVVNGVSLGVVSTGECGGVSISIQVKERKKGSMERGGGEKRVEVARVSGGGCVVVGGSSPCCEGRTWCLSGGVGGGGVLGF